MAKPSGHGFRFWRWLLVALGALLALLLAASVFLQTSMARALLVEQINAALAPLFQGKIQIERLGGLRLWGVSDVDARIFDPGGRQVVRVQGLEARAWLPSLLWRLALTDSLQIDIDMVSIDFADVTLREDDDFGVTLATTFLPVDETESEPGEASLELVIDSIVLKRVWAHGQVAGSPALDADLIDLRANLSQRAAGFTLELTHTQLAARALPGELSPGGTVWGSIDVPDDDELPLRLEGYLDGTVAGSPLWLESLWIGDDLYARASVSRLPASFVNERVAGLALQGELSVQADAQGTLPELDFAADIDGAAAHVSLSGTAQLDGPLEAFVTLAAARVNLAQLTPDAPVTDLRVQARALLLEDDAGGLRVAHRTELDAGTVAGIRTPKTWANGRLTLEPKGSVDAAGRWGVQEAGVDAHGQYRIVLRDLPSDVVAVTAQARLEDPARLVQLGVRAAGTVSAQAELRPSTDALEAKLDLSLRRLDYRDFQARSVELRAQAQGKSSDPRVHAAASFAVLSGRAHADLSYTKREQELTFFVADIDALRLARVLGAPLPLKQANLNAEGRLLRSTHGRERIELDGKLRADLGRVGELRVTATQLELPGELRARGQLAVLRGEVVGAGKLDLSELADLAALTGFPVERSTGTLSFEIASRNTAAGSGPEISLQVDTHGLRIVEQRQVTGPITTTTAAIENKPFALEGIDGHAVLRFDPHSGELVGTVIARDRGGTLAALEAELQLSEHWMALLSEPGALLNTPCKLHLEVPSRRLQSLPPLIRPTALRGRLALDAELAGTLSDPRVRSWLTINRFRTQGSAQPLDLSANVTYSVEGGELLAHALDGRGNTVGRVLTRWQGDLRHVGAGLGDRPPVVASVDARLTGFPLDVVPELVDREIKGFVTGEASLRDWGKQARLEARLTGRNLSVGTASLPSLELTAHNRAEQLAVQLAVVTSKGSARASLEAEASWGNRVLPALKRQGTARLSAQRFELAILTPLLGAYLSEFSGVLDADAEVRVAGTETRVSGKARLEHGVVQVPAMGQRFTDISASVAVGGNQFVLQRLQARGVTGRVSVTGAARLDGFALRGANAKVTVMKHEPLPLTIEGAVLGDIWGNVNVAYLSPSTGERTLNVKVVEFHLTAPETEGHGLQSLDSAEEIRIGTRRADGAFVPLPVQPLGPGSEGDGEPQQPLRIQIDLGPNVTVARGRTAKAQLSGRLVAISTNKTHVTGRIEVKGGKLDVEGKTFEIERGVVTFDGRDPSNPFIIATARWDGPEYTVYADYVGDVESGRIKLRSEPPLSQDQIAGLLLFGDPDGTTGSSTDPNSAALAVMVAGDTAAKGLNQALGDFTKLDVRARIDTTTGSARPELLWQVSPRVVAKVTRAIGEPALGESPDRTFLTLELKLRRAWALSAVFGDHGGSALDLIWRHRY